MDKDIKQYLSPGQKNLYLVYFCFLLGIIIPPMPLVGAIFAYSNLEDGDYIWRSHYLFAIRTFIITLIGMVVALLTMMVYVGFVIYLSVFVWYIARSITPIKLIMHNKAHPAPKTLWIV